MSFYPSSLTPLPLVVAPHTQIFYIWVFGASALVAQCVRSLWNFAANASKTFGLAAAGACVEGRCSSYLRINSDLLRRTMIDMSLCGCYCDAGLVVKVLAIAVFFVLTFTGALCMVRP